MDNYSIITVLGTAVLGLIKSKIGSGIQLKLKCYTYFSESYDVAPEEATNVIQFIRSLEPFIHQNGYLLSIEQREHGNNLIRIYFCIQKLLDDPIYFRMCIEWLNSNEYDFEDWVSAIANDNLLNFVEKIGDKIEEKFNIYNRGDDFTYGYKKVIFNAYTDEVYKRPESNIPKLRLR